MPLRAMTRITNEIQNLLLYLTRSINLVIEKTFLER